MKLFSRKQKRPLKVTILGAGPAGLFAAQAAWQTGNEVQIFARGDRSPLYGAQYLHEPIPGLTQRVPREIAYILKGTVEGYRQKVYGDGETIKVSPEVLEPQHWAFDIRSTYDAAWERFSPFIQKTEITPTWLRNNGPLLSSDLVVWSLPLANFCVGGHGFTVQNVWAQGDAPELGRYCSVTVDPGTVVVNGEDSPRWYRASNIFGYRTAEWPDGPRPPVAGIARVSKPIAHLCDCWLQLAGERVLRVGRFGTWTKGELSHQAYYKTFDAIEAM